MAQSEIYDHLRAFDNQYVPFPPFVEASNAIKANLQLYKETGLARHMLVTGESGTGKSSLCRWLSLEHPRREQPERDKVEVLITAVPPTASVASVTVAMLKALGDPYPERGTIAAMTNRVVTLCRNCGVCTVLLDEAQHLHDRGDTKTHYMVTDWLKSLIDKLGVPTVLLGLPRVESLLLINEQLRRRFSSRRQLILGQSGSQSAEQECYQLFYSLASLIQIPVTCQPYNAQEMGSRLYFGSGGRVAYIKKLLFAALQLALEKGMDRIDPSVLEQAFTNDIWWEGVGSLNPFHPQFAFRSLDRGGEPFQIEQLRADRRHK